MIPFWFKPSDCYGEALDVNVKGLKQSMIQVPW